VSWTFHSADRSHPTRRSIAEDRESRLRTLKHRELDLVSRLSILFERRELYPREVTKRQVAELNRRLDDVRAEIDQLRADGPPVDDGW
jgi:hypothetical protein